MGDFDSVIWERRGVQVAGIIHQQFIMDGLDTSNRKIGLLNHYPLMTFLCDSFDCKWRSTVSTQIPLVSVMRKMTRTRICNGLRWAFFGVALFNCLCCFSWRPKFYGGHLQSKTLAVINHAINRPIYFTSQEYLCFASYNQNSAGINRCCQSMSASLSTNINRI
jgi:hypothetical protein